MSKRLERISSGLRGLTQQRYDIGEGRSGSFVFDTSLNYIAGGTESNFQLGELSGICSLYSFTSGNELMIDLVDGMRYIPIHRFTGAGTPKVGLAKLIDTESGNNLFPIDGVEYRMFSPEELADNIGKWEEINLTPSGRIADTSFLELDFNLK